MAFLPLNAPGPALFPIIGPTRYPAIATSARNGDGSFGLTSTHSNIKLDKVTTYVFAADDLLPKI